MKVLGWPGSPLGEKLARELGAQASTLALHRFPDGETLVRIDTAVAGEDVVVAVSLDDPDSKILALAFAADTARELGARRVMLAAPYLGYMRQDTRFHPGEAVSSRTFANILSAHFDALVTVDPHLHRWHALGQIFGIPTRAVAAAPAIAEWVRANVTDPLVVGPDMESEPWAADVASLAHAPYLVLEKTRLGDRDVEVRVRDSMPDLRRTPVLVDDIVSTGHTLAQAAAALKAQGWPAPVAVAVHALFDAEALRTLHDAGIERVVTCDTIGHASNAIPVAAQLALGVREMIAG